MKRFVVMLLTTLLTSALVPAADGTEPERENALQRFAERQENVRLTKSPPSSRPSSENDTAAIAKLIDDINASARKNKQRTLSIITINTDVAGTTLEQQKTRTGLTFGDLYVAHALALSTRKKFDAIVALKKSGESWAQIARAHKVRLKGSKELLEEMKRK
jgi:hypothetical protein